MCNSRVEIQTRLDAADDPIKLYENHLSKHEIRDFSTCRNFIKP